MSTFDPKWNQRYQDQDTPWDMGFPSRELTRYLDSGILQGQTAIELGCGTGTNAILLASRGFKVTAVDGSTLAIQRARQVSIRDQIHVEWLEADVCSLPDLKQPFDLIFDRGCYHCVRKTNLDGYLTTLEQVSRPGSQFVVLTGNADEQRDGGPPRLTQQELKADLEPLFEFVSITPFRFDDPDGPTGPLGWSCHLIRR